MSREQCPAEWLRPLGAMLVSRSGVVSTDVATNTCQREKGHDGEHEAVVPDGTVRGLQYRMTWEVPNASR